MLKLAVLLASSAFAGTAADVWTKAGPSLAAILTRQNVQGQPDVNGSGFIVENSADRVLILTNFHVVQVRDMDLERQFKTQRRVKVEFMAHDLDVFEAVIEGVDPLADLALLKVDPGQHGESQRRRLARLPALALGDSDELTFGDPLLVVGHPLGNRNTPTFAQYTGAGAFVEDKVVMLRFNGDVSPGNSGGPLLNLKGEAVGINTSMLPPPAQVGFAVPSNLIAFLLPQLRDRLGKPHERVQYGALGAALAPLDGEMMRILGLGTRKGAIVSRVDRDGAGYFDGAGLRRGDVVVGVEGRDFEGLRSIEAATLFSRWDRKAGEKDPASALRLEIVPAHRIFQDRGADPDSTWRIAVLPDRKGLKEILSPPPPRTRARDPRFLDKRATILRLMLRQSFDGVWIERDLNEGDAAERRLRSERFIRELIYRSAGGVLVRKEVAQIKDIEDALARDTPAKVLLVLSPDLKFGPSSPAEYYLVAAPR